MAGDDEMALVSDLAVYGRVAGSTRAIDRYARAVSGSLDAFDQELVGALSRSWFSIVRFTARHPVAGWYVDDLLLERTGLWLMNEALEQSAREGMSLGTRLFEVGGFVLSTGAAAPLTDAWMDALRDDLWTRRKPGSLSRCRSHYTVPADDVARTGGTAQKRSRRARSEARLPGRHPVPAPVSRQPPHPTVGESSMKPGSPTASPEEMVALTGRITAAYLRGNVLPAADIAGVIGIVHGSLLQLVQPAPPQQEEDPEAGSSDPQIGHGRVHRLPGGRQEAENAQASPERDLRHDAGPVPGQMEPAG